MISAVWLVRSHQIAADLRYWLTYIGYDRRDHSLSHKVYLAYASIFFSAWIFATLTLLASWAGKILSFLSGSEGSLLSASWTAAGALTVVLLGWWFFTAVRAGQFSPITFSEDDAALICQTPASRSGIALLWQLGDWIKIGPAFWAFGVTMGFALQDQALGAAVGVEYVPRYVLAGIKMLLVMVPLQWGFMALGYAWGVLRLQGDRVRRFWWVYPTILGLLLMMLFSTQLTGQILVHIAANPVLKVLVFPIAGGLGLENWGFALWVSILWGGVGTFALAFSARQLNLGRAAQESSLRSAVEAAQQAGNMQAANEISIRRRLGAGHAPTRLPARPNWQGLIWKAALVWNRRGILAMLGLLLVIFVAGLAVVLAPDWGARMWATLIWLVAVQQFSAAPLADDLRLWALFRGLPMTGRQILLGELLLPAGLVIGLSWGAVAAAQLLVRVFPSGSQTGWIAVLVPGAVFASILAAAFDILRNCRSGRLLTGQVPLSGTLGVVIGGAAAGLGGLMVQWVGDGPLGYLYGGVILCWLSYLLLNMVSDALRRIE